MRLLEARELAYGYRGRQVGRGVSLAVDAGEVICLLGPNGSGKTTLFRTLLGLLPALGGAVFVGGFDLRTLDRRTLGRMVSYVPQAHAAFFPFTVSEVVLMGRTSRLGLFASPSGRDHEIAAHALGCLGLGHLADALYTRLSGGERQLVLIARALAQEASVVVMDEPAANLDFGNQVRVLDQVRMLARGNVAVIFSTHDPDHAFRCADRALLLRDGQLVSSGAPGTAITPATLGLLYDVGVTVADVMDAAGAWRRVCVPSTGRSAGAGVAK